MEVKASCSSGQYIWHQRTLIVTFCQEDTCCSTELEMPNDCTIIGEYINDQLGDCYDKEFKVHEEIIGEKNSHNIGSALSTNSLPWYSRI